MEAQPVGSDAEHATRPEEEMDGKGIEEPEGPNFPPWPLKTLLVWIVMFFVLTVAVSVVFGIVISLMNLFFKLDLTTGDIAAIGQLVVIILYPPAVFLFIVSKLRRTPFSLRDVWVSYRIDPKQFGFSLLLGLLFTLLSVGVRKAVTGEVDRPPLSPLLMDWRLMLCVDLLVTCIMTAVVEETIFRGLIYEALRWDYSTMGAALRSAFVFAAYHIDRLAYPLALVSIFLFGFVAAILLERTRSLNTSIGFHFSANVTTTAIYYLAYIVPK